MAKWRRTAMALVSAGCLILAGCADKSDVEHVEVPPFATAGTIGTVVVAPDPGHPALRPYLEAAYKEHQLSSDVIEVPHSREMGTALQKLRQEKVSTIVVELTASDQPTAMLEKLIDADVSVLCIGERPVKGSHNCTVFVGWDDWAGGYGQSEALVKALGEPEGRRWNVESAGLEPGNKAGVARLRGSVFQRLPHRDTSPTITKTGQLSYTQVEVPGAKPELFEQKLRTTIEATYMNQPMDGLVLPTDDYLPAAEAAFKNLKRPLPKIVAAGATPAGVKALGDGRLVATEYRDPELLAHESAQSLSTLRHGKALVASPRRNWENRFSEPTTVWITPMTVTRENAAQALANAPELLAELP